MIKFLASSALAALVISPASLAAQQEDTPTRSEYTQASESAYDPGATRIRLEGERLPMSLADVVMTTFQQNLDIEVRGLDIRMDEQDSEIAWSVYDPVLAANLRHTRGKQPTASIPFGAGDPGGDTGFVINERATGGGIELEQLLPVTGARAYAGLDHSRRTVRDRRAGESVLSPAYSQRFFIGLRQPLLKNLGAKAEQGNIRVSRLQVDATRAVYHYEVLNQISEVMQAYWDLVFALRNLEVQQASLESALELERVNQARLDAGAAPRSDVLQARAQVAARRSNVITAQAGIVNAQDRLLNLMNWNRYAGAWDRPIQPVDRPTTYSLTLEFDDDEAVAIAVMHRPDYRAAQYRTDIAQITRDVASWQRLPELNLFAELGLNGLDDSKWGAFDDVTDREYPDYMVGVEVRFPLTNRRARGEYQRSRYAQEQAHRLLERSELAIVTQVRSATRSIRTAQETIEASQAEVEAARETLESERRRLEVGASTTFNVLEFQENLARAEVNEILSRVNYQKGLIELHRSQGTLLEVLSRELNVDIVLEDAVPRLPDARIFPGL